MKNLNTLVIGFALSFCPLIETAQASLPGENDLPALQTRAAQEALVGVVPAGESYRILEIETLEDGERFARVPMNDGKTYWIQMNAQSHLRVGDTLVTDKLTYLWNTPMVEETAVADGAEDDFSNEVAVFAEASNGGFPLNTGKLGMAPKCQNFISQNGSLGPWGSFVVSTISPKTHPSLFKASSDMNKVCPKFNKMNDSEKERFWVWLVAAVVNNESSCNEKVKVKGVAGATAAGLMQMHLKKEYLYGCKRGINSLSARDNLECGLTVLNNDIKRTGKVFSPKNNYFDTLRPQRGPGKKTMKLVKAYKPCA